MQGFSKDGYKHVWSLLAHGVTYINPRSTIIFQELIVQKKLKMEDAVFFRFNGKAYCITLVQQWTMGIHCGAEQQNTSQIVVQRGMNVRYFRLVRILYK